MKEGRRGDAGRRGVVMEAQGSEQSTDTLYYT